MPLLQFVTDRREQVQPKTITGPFRPIADQTKFRSIYGVVNGPQTGPWTGQQILSGEIYSADGRLRMGGDEVKGKDGKPHDVQSGSTVFREYQVPVAFMEKWNAYEAAQGNNTQDEFIKAEQAARGSGVKLDVDHEIVEDQEPQFQSTPAKTTVVGGWTPERRAAQAAKMKAKHAQKALEKL